MERETGIEPATFSLGIWWSFENKELMRPWQRILNITVHAESASCEIAFLNAVIAVTRRVLLQLPIFST